MTLLVKFKTGTQKLFYSLLISINVDLSTVDNNLLQFSCFHLLSTNFAQLPTVWKFNIPQLSVLWISTQVPLQSNNSFDMLNMFSSFTTGLLTFYHPQYVDSLWIFFLYLLKFPSTLCEHRR